MMMDLENQFVNNSVLCKDHNRLIQFFDIKKRRKNRGSRALCANCPLDYPISLENLGWRWIEFQKTRLDFERSNTFSAYQKSIQGLRKFLKENQLYTQFWKEKIQELKNHLDLIMKFRGEQLWKLSQFQNLSDYENVDQVFLQDWRLKKLQTAELIFQESFNETNPIYQLQMLDLAIELHPPSPLISEWKGDQLYHQNFRNETVKCCHDLESYLNRKCEDLESIKFRKGLHFIKLGIILSKLGRHEESQRLFNEASQICVNFIFPTLKIGFDLIELEKYEEAILYLSKILSINFLNNELVVSSYLILCIKSNNQGMSLSIVNQNEKALEILGKLPDTYPEFQVLIGTFFIYHKQKYQIPFDSILKQRNSKTLIKLSNMQTRHYAEFRIQSIISKKILQKLSRYQEALCVIETAIDMENEPDFHLFKGLLFVLHNLAKILVDLKRYTEALEQYDKILQIDFQCLEANLFKGMILEVQKQQDVAIKCFQIIRQINDSYSPYCFYMGTNHLIKGIKLFQLKEFEEAIKNFDKCIEQEGVAIELYHLKGASLFNLGKVQEAIQICDDLIKLDQKNPFNYFLKALFINQGGNNEFSFEVEGKQCISEAQKLDKNFSSHYFQQQFLPFMIEERKKQLVRKKKYSSVQITLEKMLYFKKRIPKQNLDSNNYIDDSNNASQKNCLTYLADYFLKMNQRNTKKIMAPTSIEIEMKQLLLQVN